MNEDKLKELETKFPYHKEVIELITTYRQLEKDNKALDEKHDDCIDSLCDAADEYFKMKEANAELLAANLEAQTIAYNGGVHFTSSLYQKEALSKIFKKLFEAYNKHKGE